MKLQRPISKEEVAKMAGIPVEEVNPEWDGTKVELVWDDEWPVEETLEEKQIKWHGRVLDGENDQSSPTRRGENVATEGEANKIENDAVRGESPASSVQRLVRFRKFWHSIKEWFICGHDLSWPGWPWEEKPRKMKYNYCWNKKCKMHLKRLTDYNSHRCEFAN